jgi:hypothetical protein
MADVPDVRASDSDRERVADLLRRHTTEGRLTLDELGERLSQTYAARTLGDLGGPEGPLRDLPVLRTPPPPVPVLQTGHRPAPRLGKGFPEHLTAYVAVNAFLILIWVLTGFGYFWPIWPMAGWGIGVAIHYGVARSHADRRPLP